MTEQEIDVLAEKHGKLKATPVIRSMYPSKSRGEMSREFSESYKAGYQAAMKENEKLNDRVKFLLEALKMARLGIETLVTTQKQTGLGLIGENIIAPMVIKNIDMVVDMVKEMREKK